MMPNWCSNTIDVIGDPNNTKEFKAFVRKAKLESEDTEDKEFFNNVIPMPKKLVDTTSGGLDSEFNSALKGNKKKKYSNWYNWRLAHWGTKWDVEPNVHFEEDNHIVIWYDTAWAPALDFWDTVSKKFPSLTIKIRYYEEGVGFIGETHFANGETTKDISGDVTTEMLIAAGCEASEDGTIDWDEDQSYNLDLIFEEGLEKYV
jgi:hypothetical protein